MWAILIRHGESMNNYLESISQKEYELKRTEDPDLSPIGVHGTERLRDFFRAHEIRFEKFFTSPHVRCLMTSRILSEAFEDAKIPVEIAVKIHEFGGCNLNGKGMPGKPRSFIEAYIPGCKVGEDIDEDGWWKSPNKETLPECIKRAKEFIAYLKKSSVGNEGKYMGYVTHGGLISIVLQLIENKPVIFDENSKFIMENWVDTTPAVANSGFSILRVDQKSIQILVANYFVKVGN